MTPVEMIEAFRVSASKKLPPAEVEALVMGATAALRRLGAAQSARDVSEANAELERLFALVRQPKKAKTKSHHQLDPVKAERLAVRMRGNRTDAEAAELAGLSGDPDLAEITKAARSKRWKSARLGLREYAVELVTEARLLTLLRIREEVGTQNVGVLPQSLSALEKTGEGLGEARPHTVLVYERRVTKREKETE